MKIATEGNFKETITVEDKEVEIINSKNSGNTQKKVNSKSESPIFINRELETSSNSKTIQSETRVVAGLVDVVRKLREKRMSQGKTRRKEFNNENSISFENRTYVIPEVSDPSVSEDKISEAPLRKERSQVNEEYSVRIDDDTVTVYKHPLPVARNLSKELSGK